MKMRIIILLFLAISLSLAADYPFLMIPGVSSVNLSVNPTSSQGIIASDVEATQNFPNNITITGNLKVSGNNTVSFVGLSSSLPVKVYLNGNIDIVDNGTLVLKYATLYFVGAQKPYDRYISLSNSTNGHPRLIILDSVIDAYTSASFVVSHTRGKTVTATASYGCAIYAYNNSEISAQQFSLYREKVYAQNYTAGGLTVIKCYGESSVNLTSVAVDSVFTYDEAQVSIYTGLGPKRITGTSSPPDAGISFECHNTSIVNLYGVTFNRIAVSEGAHLLLTHSTELSNGVITTRDRSRLDCLGGTILTSTLTIPAISAIGYSYVSLSSSQISSSFGLNPAVSLSDHATFAIVKDGVVSGKILAVGYSRVVLNNTKGYNGLVNIGIECHNSASVSIFNSTLLSPLFPVEISLFDGSSLSLVNSTIQGGWINFSNNATVYASHSLLESSTGVGYGMRIMCQDNANVTLVASQITAETLEISGNARLGLDSSFASVIYCGNSSQFSLVNGAVTELDVSDSPRVLVMNSTLTQLSLAYSNVTRSFTGLTSFLKNSTFALSSNSSEVSVLNTTINGLSFVFSGHSNVTIFNSTIRNLSTLGSSVVSLNDTVVHGSVYSVGNSRVLVYSPLRVRCLDYFGNPLNGSVVTIETGYVGAPKVLKRQTADKNGLVSFVLFSEMDNATGSFPFGVVTVSGSFGGVSTSQDVSVSLINKDVTLSFPLPSWSVYILPVVVFVVIVALLILTYYVLKRVRGKRE